MKKRRKNKRKRKSHHRLRRSFFDDDPSCCCYCYSSCWIASCCASYYPASYSSSSGVCDATTKKTSKTTTTTTKTTNERCDGAGADADLDDDLPRCSTRTYRRDGDDAIHQSSSRHRRPPRDDCDVDADSASHRRRRRPRSRLRIQLLLLLLLLLLRRSPLFSVVGRRSRRRCCLHLRDCSSVFPDRSCRGRVYRGIAACLRRSRKVGGAASCVAIREIDAFLHVVSKVPTTVEHAA